MSALLVRLLTAPRWLVIAAAAVAAVGSHAAAYRLGGAHQFRAGFSAGETAMRDRLAVRSGDRTARQFKDRLNAETRRAIDGASDDRMRCGPSTRDCLR